MHEAAELATALQLAVKALQFYAPDHPRFLEGLAQADAAASALLRLRPRVTLTTARGSLLVDGEPFLNPNVHAKALSVEMEKRQIGGFVFAAGLDRRELIELARVMAARPEQVRSEGGAAELLRRAEVVHVRISQVRYEAVTEGEEVVWSNAMRRNDVADAPADALPALLQQFLLGQLRAKGSAAGSGGGEGGTGEVGSAEGAAGRARETLGGIGSEAEGSGAVAGAEGGGGEGAGGAGDSALQELLVRTLTSGGGQAHELLRAAIEGMDPLSQLALLISVERLPPGEGNDALRVAARKLAGEFDGGSGSGSADPARILVQAIAGNDEQLTLLRDRMADMGVSREELDELLDVLSWERLGPDQRLAKLLGSERIFDFPADKLLTFVRQLLDAGKHEGVQRLVEHYSAGAGHESYYVRQTVCDTLGQMALFIKEPGLSRQAEQVLGTVILNRLVKETDRRMKTVLAGSAANFIAMLVATGRAEPALRVLGRIDLAVSAAAEGALVREAALALQEGFGEPHRAGALVEQAIAEDAEGFINVITPLMARLGGAPAPRLLEALGTEEDRNRRGRLVKALKAIGEPAFPYLVEALRSPMWYVVRNALSVLGDIGTEEQAGPVGRRLEHGDPRVRRTAARALSKIGGPEAEAMLIQAMNDRDVETQVEVLHCLGAIKAVGAVPGLTELARSRGIGAADDKVRELAATTLGQIASEAAVPALGEILRGKSFFGRDTPAVRIAAGRALSAINTTAARDMLRAAAESESDRTTRLALSKLLGP